MSTSAAAPLESFFGRRINQRTMGPQLLIALVAGIAFSLSMLSVYLTLGEAQQIYGGLVLVLMLLYALIPVLLWATATTVIYLIASFLNARVEMSILWRMLGWGMAPMIGSGLALGVGQYLALRSHDPCQYLVCEVGKYVNITTQGETVYAYVGSALGAPVMQALAVIGVLFFLVMTYLWVIITYQASTLTRAGAAIAAGIPGLTSTALFALAVL